jgi:uncharacterized phiE125 gp8 family phage protein
MAITDITPPAVLPVTLDYAKTFLRVDNDDEDALITDLINSAAQRVERLINSALIIRARRLSSAKVSGSGVFINHTEVKHVTAVRVISDDITAEIPLASLSINLRCHPPAVRVKDRLSFKSYQASADTVEIDFIAGHGEAPDDIPMPLRQAVLLLLAQAFEYRGRPDAPPTVPMMVDALLMPYRSLRI